MEDNVRKAEIRYMIDVIFDKSKQKWHNTNVRDWW